MSDQNGAVERPSIREALFGNGHVANVRCGIKYGVWGISYLIATLVQLSIIGGVKLYRGVIEAIGVAIMLSLTPLMTRVSPVIERYAVGDWFTTQLSSVLNWVADRGESLAQWALLMATEVGHGVKELAIEVARGPFGTFSFGMMYVVLFPLIVLVGVLIEIDERTGFFSGIAGIIVFILGTLLDVVFGSLEQAGSCTKSGAGRVVRGTQAKLKEMEERPGTRRIYGYCPVSFDIAPRWYDDLGLHVRIADDDDPRLLDVGMSEQ